MDSEAISPIDAASRCGAYAGRGRARLSRASAVHEWAGAWAWLSCSWRMRPPHVDWAVDAVSARRIATAIVGAQGKPRARRVSSWRRFMVATVSGLMVSGTVLPVLGLYAPGYFFWDPLHAIAAKAAARTASSCMWRCIARWLVRMVRGTGKGNVMTNSKLTDAKGLAGSRRRLGARGAEPALPGRGAGRSRGGRRVGRGGGRDPGRAGPGPPEVPAAAGDPAGPPAARAADTAGPAGADALLRALRPEATRLFVGRARASLLALRGRVGAQSPTGCSRFCS